MSGIKSLQSTFFAPQVKPQSAASGGLKPFSVVGSDSVADIRSARDRLLRLYSQLEKLAELFNVNTRFKLDLPDARSTTALGLDMTHTAAFLNSYEEINAAPMSFSPFGPAWQDGSDALMTINGAYDGSNGNGAFGLEVRRPGTHGVNDLRIRFQTPGGVPVQTINIRDDDDPDQQYSLGNGLFLQLGPGSLINRDFATLDLFDNVGAAVDPDLPLGGVRNNNPNFEYGMPAIVDGSFLVNGESISVSTTDSLNQVIDRINQSAATVTAAFNPLTEAVEITQNTLGSAPTIDFQNDTSNFLTAAKIDNLNLVSGIDPETMQTLQDVSAFSTVQSGDILINGTLITIDAATDTLETVIGRINASPAGVDASFDTVTQEFLIEARDATSQLDIDSNGTGLFAALNITEGRVDPEAAGRGISRRRSYDIADSVTAVFAEISELFRDSAFISRAEHTGFFRHPLESAFRKAFDGGSSEYKFGLRYDDSIEASIRGDFATIERRDLTRDLQRRGDQVKQLFAGKNDDEGLVSDLLRATRQALAQANQSLGFSGTFLDTRV
ncbi:MAG: hypothetical protein OEM63_00240 [Gammaproteobacteria bacterium]|nr:hypothetical protein [Gammaproteobacteria bacterium]